MNSSRRALLHVGMNKTGSSSIQRAFAKYADSKTRYLRLGEPNHSACMSFAFQDPIPGNMRARMGNRDLETLRRESRTILSRELERDDRSIVISAEGLSTFGGVDACRRLVDFLGDYVGEIKALGYVREPAGFVSSNFQQVVRQTLPPDDLTRLIPNYRRRFGDWCDVLGEAHVELVPFSKAAFREGDLLVDFADRAGLSRDHVSKNAIRKNDSLSAEATAILYALRYRHSKGDGPKINRAGARDVIRLLRKFGQSKFAFDPGVFADAIAENSKDIEWVEARMAQKLPGPSNTDATAFKNTGAILDFADGLRPELARFLRRHRPISRFTTKDPMAVLEQILFPTG